MPTTSYDITADSKLVQDQELRFVIQQPTPHVARHFPVCYSAEEHMRLKFGEN
jgi:hypothetical protein